MSGARMSSQESRQHATNAITNAFFAKTENGRRIGKFVGRFEHIQRFKTHLDDREFNPCTRREIQTLHGVYQGNS